jgi:ABC-type transporter Mla subunit MlaD
VSDGFFGQKYVQIVPGDSDKLISDGSSILYTQPAINLEDLIVRMVLRM